MNNDVRIQSCIITVIFVTKHDICAKLLNVHSLKDEGLREKRVLSHWIQFPFFFPPVCQYAGKWEYSFEVSLETTAAPVPNPRIVSASLPLSSGSAAYKRLV